MYGHGFRYAQLSPPSGHKSSLAACRLGSAVLEMGKKKKNKSIIPSKSLTYLSSRPFFVLANIVFQFDVHHNQIDSRSSSVSSLTGDGQDGTYKVNGRKIPLTVHSILFYSLGIVLPILTHQSRMNSLKPCHILKSLSITTTVGLSFGVEYISMWGRK